jgi:hypothetical protein
VGCTGVGGGLYTGVGGGPGLSSDIVSTAVRFATAWTTNNVCFQ